MTSGSSGSFCWSSLGFSLGIVLSIGVPFFTSAYCLASCNFCIWSNTWSNIAKSSAPNRLFPTGLCSDIASYNNWPAIKSPPKSMNLDAAANAWDCVGVLKSKSLNWSSSLAITVS